MHKGVTDPGYLKLSHKKLLYFQIFQIGHYYMKAHKYADNYIMHIEMSIRNI